LNLKFVKIFRIKKAIILSSCKRNCIE